MAVKNTNITPKKGPFNITFTPGAMLTTVQVDNSVTVTGLTTDDTVVVEMPSLETGVIFSHAWVSAANTLKIRLYNPTASTITPAAQAASIVVL